MEPVEPVERDTKARDKIGYDRKSVSLISISIPSVSRSVCLSVRPNAWLDPSAHIIPECPLKQTLAKVRQNILSKHRS